MRFDALPPADTARRSEAALWVCPTVTPPCASSASGTDAQSAVAQTDVSGRASATIRLGAVAGVARIVVSAPTLGLRDTVRATVLPGAATAIRMAMRDTMLHPGGVATLRPVVVDASGNQRADVVAASGDAADVAEVGSGGVVTGRSVGRVRVALRSATVTDSAFVSVVPRGRLVAWVQRSAGLDLQLATLDMDGSNLRALAPAMGAWGVLPAWSPSGQYVAFHTSEVNFSNVPTHVYVADTLGAKPLAITTAWGDLSYHPHVVSSDEMEYVVSTSGRYDVYRVGIDNTRARRLTSLVEPPISRVGVMDVSADGRRIAYTVADGSLVVFEVATSTTRRLGVLGDRPRWSPDGSLIVYRPNTGGLAVIRADGTGDRLLTATAMSEGPAWSPDGAYLLARLAVVQPNPR